MVGVPIDREGECGLACGGRLDVACPEGEFCKSVCEKSYYPGARQ